jgi:hypothetical protein
MSMKNYLFSRQGSRGRFIIIASILAAICAMAISVNHQVPEQPACGGMLGAGFPAILICDNWGGGSPTNSWDKITFVDILNGGIKPGGFVVDLLFYSVLSYVIIYLMLAIYQRVTSTKTRL